MKKLLIILFTALLCLVICSCGDSTEDNYSSDLSSVNSVGENEDVYPLADASYESFDGMPPLNDELKQLFSDSMELYRELVVGTGEKVTVDGQENCYQLMKYASLQDVTHAALSCFTTDFYENEIKTLIDNCFEKDGVVYVKVIEAEKGEYTGHYFEIRDVYDESIELIATVFYEPDKGTDIMTYKTNLGDGECQIQKYDFCIKKSTNGWRFDKFVLFY